MNEEHNFNISWKTCARLIICVLIAFLVIHYWGGIEGLLALVFSGLLAIFFGLMIAYMGNIPMRFFEEKLPGEPGDNTLNRYISLGCTIVCAVGLLLLVCVLVIPQLVQAAIKIANQVPALIDAILSNDYVQSLLPEGFMESFESIDWGEILGNVTSWLQSGLGSSLPQIMSIFTVIGAVCMGFILAFWFLIEKNRLSSDAHVMIRSYISQSADEKYSKLAGIADECFSGYFSRQFLEGVIYAVLIAVPCAILGIPNALMLGILVGFMSLIPMVGAVIGAVLGAIITLASSWQQALIFVVVFIIVQQIEANLIYPRVVGKHLGLYGLWPLIGITMGVTLFGFIGAFIGVPITATIFRIVDEDLKKRAEEPDGDATPLQKLHKSLSD